MKKFVLMSVFAILAAFTNVCLAQSGADRSVADKPDKPCVEKVTVDRDCTKVGGGASARGVGGGAGYERCREKTTVERVGCDRPSGNGGGGSRGSDRSSGGKADHEPGHRW